MKIGGGRNPARKEGRGKVRTGSTCRNCLCFSRRRIFFSKVTPEKVHIQLLPWEDKGVLSWFQFFTAKHRKMAKRERGRKGVRFWGEVGDGMK